MQTICLSFTLNEKTPRTSTEFETTELNLPNAAAGGANSALPAKGKSLMEEDIFLHGMNHSLFEDGNGCCSCPLDLVAPCPTLHSSNDCKIQTPSMPTKRKPQPLLLKQMIPPAQHQIPPVTSRLVSSRSNPETWVLGLLGLGANPTALQTAQLTKPRFHPIPPHHCKLPTSKPTCATTNSITAPRKCNYLRKYGPPKPIPHPPLVPPACSSNPLTHNHPLSLATTLYFGPSH
jgi:hypothetical protein